MSKLQQPAKNIVVGSHGPRTVALIGPYGSGKTLLLESIAVITGAIARKGSVTAGSSLGDTTAEARARAMSVETNVLTTRYPYPGHRHL